MKSNIGKIDKTIRLLLSAVAVIAYFMIPLPTIWGIILLANAGFIVLTVLMNRCPMCAIFGINTCEISPKSSAK